MKIDRYLKAIIAALGMAATAYLASRSGGMTANEWGDVLMAGLAGLGIVYAVPNAKAPAEEQPAEELTQPTSF